MNTQTALAALVAPKARKRYRSVTIWHDGQVFANDASTNDLEAEIDSANGWSEMANPKLVQSKSVLDRHTGELVFSVDVVGRR